MVAGESTGFGNGRSFSRFFSSVRKNALRVVLRALLGLHRAASRGECAQTGQLSGREFWPGARGQVSSVQSAQGDAMSGQERLTGIANGLITAGQPKRVQGQLVADGASELKRYLILGEGAGTVSTGTIFHGPGLVPTLQCPSGPKTVRG